MMLGGFCLFVRKKLLWEGEILIIVHFRGGFGLLSTRGRPAKNTRESGSGEILKIVLFWEGPADVGSEVKVDRRASGFYKILPRAYILYIRESAGPAVHRSTPL